MTSRRPIGVNWGGSRRKSSLLHSGRLGGDSEPQGYAFFTAIQIRVKLKYLMAKDTYITGQACQ
jgi:hypothetical protein